MKDALGALFYLELRTWVNRLRVIARDPKRLVPWVIFLAWLGITQIARIISLVGGHTSRVPQDLGFRNIALVVLAAVPGLYLVLIGIVVGASRAAPADFSSPADARYLAGSPLSQRTVVLWLQARKFLNPRLVLSLFIGTALLALYSVSVGNALILQLTLFAAVLAVLGLQLPLFLARRKLPRLPWTVLAWAIVLAGLAAAGIGAMLALGVRGFPGEWRVVTQLPPGTLVASGMAGDPRALAALVVLAGLSLALAVFVAGDSYPELWEASRRRFTLVRVMRRRGMLSRSEVRQALQEGQAEPDQKEARKAASVQGARVPAGAMTIVWKEWMAMRRRRGGIRLQVVLLGGSLVAGTVLGLMLAGGNTGAGAVVGGFAFPVVILSAYSRISLAIDLRNPLWWLSRAGLAERLAAWTLAGTLRSFVIIGAGAGVALALSQPTDVLVTGLVALFAGIWTMRAVSLAVYAFIPSSLDMFGPGVMVRVIAIYALSTPPAMAGIAAGLLAENVTVGLVAGSGVALAESLGLLAFATYRIQGNGLGFARAESR